MTKTDIFFDSLDAANVKGHFSIYQHNSITSIKYCHFHTVTSFTCDQAVIGHIFTKFHNLCLIPLYIIDKIKHAQIKSINNVNLRSRHLKELHPFNYMSCVLKVNNGSTILCKISRNH